MNIYTDIYTRIHIYMYICIHLYMSYTNPPPTLQLQHERLTLKPQPICVGKCLPGAPHERHHTPVLKNTPYAMLPTT